jgi:hypothetical protein
MSKKPTFIGTEHHFGVKSYPKVLKLCEKCPKHTGLKTGKHSILHRIRTTPKPYKILFYPNM